MSEDCCAGEPLHGDPNGFLFAFDSGGYRAGSFTTVLIEAIQRADVANRAKLALGFPGYVTAVTWAMDDLGGIDRLREVAGPLAGPVRA